MEPRSPMTTAAIMQPTYLPWLGYFAMMAEADACRGRPQGRTLGGDLRRVEGRPLRLGTWLLRLSREQRRFRQRRHRRRLQHFPGRVLRAVARRVRLASVGGGCAVLHWHR